MPVGRVHFLYLYPLSFAEFLDAVGHDQLKTRISAATINNPVEEFLEHKLLELLRIYLLVGGMPAAIKQYIDNQDLHHCQMLQSELLQTYRGDFGKYAKMTDHKYLQRVFDAVPRLLGQRVRYVQVI